MEGNPPQNGGIAGAGFIINPRPWADQPHFVGRWHSTSYAVTKSNTRTFRSVRELQWRALYVVRKSGSFDGLN